jgi:hypothetical protein
MCVGHGVERTAASASFNDDCRLAKRCNQAIALAEKLTMFVLLKCQISNKRRINWAI